MAKLSDAICNRNKFPMPQFTGFMEANIPAYIFHANRIHN